ncbi:GspE/PulE family protein [Desulfonatronum thioautotrophicum]|uniref:GspE/PulE family protein n=1 Tax=Desulfonatronum thioautotrophicum TaxID=617001 RepID=UPI0005EB9F02|nr:GspE/PulE family protein [Desulfonatronum thioautotrophicum]
MSTEPRRKLGEMLVEAGLARPSHIAYALVVQEATRQRIGEVLSSLGLVAESDVYTVLGRQHGLPVVQLVRDMLDLDGVERLGKGRCLSLGLAPVRINGKSAVVGPELLDERRREALASAYQRVPPYALTPRSVFEDILAGHVAFKKASLEETLRREIQALAEDASQTRAPDECINAILHLAATSQATDIHFQPMPSGIGVALRVDGILRQRLHLPAELARMINALKFKAGMDMGEQRLPQDGRFSVELFGKGYDVRVSTVATPYGEDVVLRLLPKRRTALTLTSLGFFPEDRNRLETAFREPAGVVILAGPTGAGKSTTMVAGLSSLDLTALKVLTVENPIEHVVPMARQTQVNTEAGYTFETAMRQFLRHDPDVILVGEIRDTATARTAMTAALTGHLVLTTVHATTAAGVLARLRTFDIDPLTMAETLVSIVSQRLVRVPCPRCGAKRPQNQQPAPDVIEAGNEGALECADCSGTGYKGRTVIYEILDFDAGLKALVLSGASPEELVTAARQRGFQDMLEVGRKKAALGQTTQEELRRVLGRTADAPASG